MAVGCIDTTTQTLQRDLASFRAGGETEASQVCANLLEASTSAAECIYLWIHLPA